MKLFSVDGKEEDTDEEDRFFFGVRVVVIGDVEERSPKKFEIPLDLNGRRSSR